MTLKFDRWPKKIIGHLFYTTSSFVHNFKSIGGFKLKLQSWKAQFRSKLVIFLSRVTLKFDGWPWITIGHLFHTTSSNVHHFKAMGKFKLELQSGKHSIRVKIGHFLSRVTLKSDGWPWKTIGHLFYTTSSFVHHFKAIGEFKWNYSLETLNSGQNRYFFVPCDLEIWHMTLKNNRGPLLCCFKLFTSFHSHQWIQAGVTVSKRPIWVKINFFLSHVTLKFDRWSWKTTGHL